MFEFQRFALKIGVYERALASWPLNGLVSTRSFLRSVGYLDDLHDVPIDQLFERVDAKPDEPTNKHRFFKVSVLLFYLQNIGFVFTKAVNSLYRMLKND